MTQMTNPMAAIAPVVKTTAAAMVSLRDSSANDSVIQASTTAAMNSQYNAHCRIDHGLRSGATWPRPSARRHIDGL